MQANIAVHDPDHYNGNPMHNNPNRGNSGAVKNCMKSNESKKRHWTAHFLDGLNRHTSSDTLTSNRSIVSLTAVSSRAYK